MKIDTTFLKDILLFLQDSETSDVSCDSLLIYLGYNFELNIFEHKGDAKLLENEKLGSKIIFHIKILYEINAIDCNNSNLGFYAGDRITSVNIYYRITLTGLQLLETMLNDTWWNNFKDKVGNITKETLSQAPAIAISFILEQIK